MAPALSECGVQDAIHSSLRPRRTYVSRLITEMLLQLVQEQASPTRMLSGGAITCARADSLSIVRGCHTGADVERPVTSGGSCESCITSAAVASLCELSRSVVPAPGSNSTMRWVTP